MITRKQAFYILWISGILVNTLPRIFDFGTLSLIGEHYSPWGKYWYYSGQAISYLLLIPAMCFKGKGLTERKIFGVGIWLMISNAFDELGVVIGTDPTHLGWNELLFVFFIIFWLFFIRRTNANT